MRYTIKISKTASKYLERMPEKYQIVTEQKIDLLRIGRFDLCDIDKYEGNDALFRMRIGKYRMLYERHDDIFFIHVIKIGPRGDVYK